MRDAAKDALQTPSRHAHGSAPGAGPSGPADERQPVAATVPGPGELAVVLNHLADGVCVVDGEQRVLYTNRRLAEMLDLPAELLRPGDPLVKLSDFLRARGEYGDEATFGRMRAILLEGPRRPFEYERTRPDGTVLEVRGNPSPNGGFVVTFRDVTETRKAVAALEESRQLYHDFTSAASDWQWEMDAELRFVRFSIDHPETIELRPELGLGKTRWETAGADPDDPDWRCHREDLEARRPFRDFRYSFLGPDGRRRYRRVSGKPLFDGDGRFLGYRGVARDDTEAAEARATAEATQALLSATIESISEAVALYGAEGKLVFANRKYREILLAHTGSIVPGVRFEDILRAGVAQGAYPDAEGREEAFIGERLEAFRDCDRPIVFRLADGRWIEAKEYPLADGGRLSIRTNVTDRIEWMETLQRSESRFRSLADNLPGLVYQRRLERDGTIAHPYVGPHLVDMLGVRPEEITSGRARLQDFIHPEDQGAAERAVWLSAEQLSPLSHTLRMVRRDGGVRWWDTHSTPQRLADGRIQWDCIALDRTEQKEAEARLSHLAWHDPLTDLPNRAAFSGFVDQLIPVTRRTEGRFAVIALNLRRFAEVNRTLGIRGGDEALRRIGPLIVGRLRPGDMVARVAGDQFLVLLTGLRRSEDVRRPVQKMTEALAEGIVLNGARVPFRAAMGVALFPEDGTTAEELMEAADVTLKRVRRDGHGDYGMHSPGMTENARRMIALERDLARAIEQDELVVHYQPQVSLRTSAVTGVEALVRWQHPEHGLVPPSEFIPVAEDTGLIAPLGEWVLRHACRQVHAWRRSLPSLNLAVNLSARQLADGDLGERILAILAETGFDAAALELELTESMLLADAERVAGLLGELNARGVRFALDDFGTGYSSLAYLAKFPIHSLKIDRTFVADMPEHAAHASIVSMICGMARSLGMTTVAEGVETREQLMFLRAYQCDAAQGFLLARPMPAPALEAFLASPEPVIPRGRGDVIPRRDPR